MQQHTQSELLQLSGCLAATRLSPYHSSIGQSSCCPSAAAKGGIKSVSCYYDTISYQE